MLNVNGVEVIKQFVELYFEFKVIILLIYDDENYVIYVLKIGVRGYLLKEMDVDILIEVVKVVVEGGFYFYLKVIYNFVNEFCCFVISGVFVYFQYEVYFEICRLLYILIWWECEVLQMFVDGKSNCGIGELLFISEKIVKNYVSNIL